MAGRWGEWIVGTGELPVLPDNDSCGGGPKRAAADI